MHFRAPGRIYAFPHLSTCSLKHAAGTFSQLSAGHSKCYGSRFRNSCCCQLLCMFGWTTSQGVLMGQTCITSGRHLRLAEGRDIAMWNLQVEDLLRGDEPDAITFERIHGRSSNMIQAKDLDLHTFAPRDFLPLERANGAAGQLDLPAEPERVLLTGANGFLGRFLLLDFLQRVSTK